MLGDPVFTRIHGFGFESLQDLQAGAALLNWNGTVPETVTLMPQPLPLIIDLVHNLELFASLLLTDGERFRACVTGRSQTIGVGPIFCPSCSRSDGGLRQLTHKC
jgi:hypothetical protein